MIVALVSQLAFANPSADQLAADMLRDISVASKTTLVSPGKAPHKVVTFRPKAGATAIVDMATGQDLEMSMVGPNGETIPMSMAGMTPTTTMRLKTTVGNPVANGLTPVRMEYLDMGVVGGAPEVRDEVVKSLQPLKGLSYSLLWDPERNRVVQVDVSGASALADAAQAMADQMAQNLANFPTEPVGVGAKWTVEMDMNIAGLELMSTQTFTLDDIQGDVVVMSVVLDMKKGDSDMALPGLPPGAKVDFTRFDATGSGTMRTDLTTFSSTSDMTTKIDMAMSIAADGAPPMSMGMKMTQTVSMKPGK